MRKTVFVILQILAIFFAILHFTFLSVSTPTVDPQSMLLNFLPYGLPILIFGLAGRSYESDKPRWSRSGVVNMVLFTLTFIAMSAHVTLAFFYSNNSFANSYFNIPIIYTVPLLLFAVLWYGTKNIVNLRGERGAFGKLISVLPKLILIAMAVHIIIASVAEILRQSGGLPSTSAPWWVIPLIITTCYIIALAFALLMRGIYDRIKAEK